MPSTININGKCITHSKGGVSIINGLVVFGDGSTYDTATGVFVNRGVSSDGIIVNGQHLTGQPQDAVDKPARSERVFDRFTATGLVLNVQAASYTVEPYSGPGIEVSLAGPPELLDAYVVEVGGDNVHIKEGSPASTNQLFASSGGVAAMQITGSVTVVGGNIYIGSQEAVRVTVRVPVGTPITINTRGHGDVRIGDVRGQLSIAIQGSGDVKAASVARRLAAQVQGSGDVIVAGGMVDTITASVYGSGDIQFNGTAHTAHLSVFGSGNVRVERCLTPPSETMHGSGRIAVRQVG